MIYSQSSILYEIIPHSLRPSMDPTKPPLGPHTNGVVNSSDLINSITGQLNQISFQANPLSQAETSDRVVTPPSKVMRVHATN